jgi:hypothetical protein
MISGICSLNDNRAEENTTVGVDSRACDRRDNWNEMEDPAKAELDWKVKKGTTKPLMRD